MTEPQTIDLLISGGTFILNDQSLPFVEDYSIAIDQGKIISVFPRGSIAYNARRTIDATDCIIMPGLINAHAHLPMTYFRGLADDLPLHNWLHDFIWPLEAKMVSRDFVYQASLHGAAEMIKNGITHVHDMYFQMPAIADACTQAGIRATIGEAVLDIKLDSSSPREAIGSKVLELRQRYSSNPLIDFDLAPHAIYSCSQATLEKCAQVASDNSIRLHTHLSESRAEVEECVREHGMKPVFYLRQLGLLSLPAVYAHGIWVDEDEIELLADSPASIAICTESNLKLASGILPLKSYLDKGVNACFGTDGVASNNNLDLFSEMEFTAKLHKTLNNDPGFLPAMQVVQMATLGAAKALGVSNRRGSLVPGKDADICILSLDSLDCHPVYNPFSHVVYALGARHVRDVIIAGEVALDKGILTKVDEAEIIQTAKHQRSRMLAELQK